MNVCNLAFFASCSIPSGPRIRPIPANPSRENTLYFHMAKNKERWLTHFQLCGLQEDVVMRQAAPYHQQCPHGNDKASLCRRCYVYPSIQNGNRHRGDSNPCGQSPMNFESISLAARTQCLLLLLVPHYFTSHQPTPLGTSLHVHVGYLRKG